MEEASIPVELSEGPKVLPPQPFTGLIIHLSGSQLLKVLGRFAPNICRQQRLISWGHHLGLQKQTESSFH